MDTATSKQAHRFARIGHRLILVAAVALVASVAISGCSSTKQLDTFANQLITAVLKNDYRAFSAIVPKPLLKKFSSAEFGRLSRLLGHLGPYASHRRVHFEIMAGAPNRGLYELVFKKGTVKLQIEVDNEQLFGFSFSGDGMMKAQRMDLDVFEFRSFSLHHGRSNAKPQADNVFQPGGIIKFKGEIHGYSRDKEGKYSLQVALQILSGDTVLWEKTFINAVDRQLPPDESPLRVTSGEFRLRRPGVYSARLIAKDGKNRSVVSEKQSFSVEPKTETAQPPQSSGLQPSQPIARRF